jgi:ATP-binding cassette subfamily B protein
MENIKQTGLRRAISRIISLIWLDKHDITAIYIYSIFAGLVSLSLPLGIQTIIGFVQAGSISTSIVVLIILVLIGTFITGFLQVRQLQMIEKIEQKIFVRYAIDYTERLPMLDIQKLDGYYLPELVNRFFDTPNLQKSLHKLLVDIPAAIIQIVFGVILLSFYHPLFIAFGIFLFAIILIIMKLTSLRGFETLLETSDFKYKAASWLEEMARGIKTFKYARYTTLHVHKMDTLLGGYLQSRTDHFKILQIQYWALIVFRMLIIAAMLILGVTLLLDQQINIGQFIAADIVIVLIMGSVEKLISNMDKIYEALISVEKLDKIAKAAIEDSGTVELPNDTSGLSIVMKDVNFGYQDGIDVLQNFNMEAQPGEWVSLKGSSGSGKTSVLRLLTGAFKKKKGSILINGVPIQNYDILSLRKQMGILLGKQDIFEGTILENITLGNSEVTLEETLEVCKLTGLDQFIHAATDGLHTRLDPFGRRLAGKVRHQILITRAVLLQNRLTLLKDPFMYLTDEQALQLVNHLKKTNTTVIIASSDQRSDAFCDKIIELASHE